MRFEYFEFIPVFSSKILPLLLSLKMCCILWQLPTHFQTLLMNSNQSIIWNFTYRRIFQPYLVISLLSKHYECYMTITSFCNFTMSSIMVPFLVVMECQQTLVLGVIKYSLKTDYELSKAKVFDFKTKPWQGFLWVMVQLI